jgi:hypothetical protein
MTNESSRYNIGSVIRTINVPTFALMLLVECEAARFAPLGQFAAQSRNSGD